MHRNLVPLVLLPLVACGPVYGPDEVEAGTIGAEIAIRGGFSPSAATLNRQENVRWQNVSTEQHHIISDVIARTRPGPTGAYDTVYLFDSGPLRSATVSAPSDTVPGAFYILPLWAPGVYPYHCKIHPGMIGTITVL